MNWLPIATFAGGVITGISICCFNLVMNQRYAVRLINQSPEGKYDET